MTVSSSTNKVSYSGNGSLTTFAYSFKIFDQDDLTVILRAADGTETTQTITTHYTVSGVGEASGGNVVFGSAPASGVTVVIIREQPLTQGLDLVPNNPFPAESLEEALDKLTFMSQKHEEELSRAIKASRTNTLTGSEFTISATDRANKVFAFDSSGNLSITQELGTFKGDWATSTAYVERDLVKDTTTNNVFIVNAAHTSSGSLPLTTNANSAKYEKIIDVTNPPGSFNVGGDLTVTGSVTGASFVIGSADINENDLEAIDSVTAGTVAASKAVVVDVNKDISSFRNLTASGTVTYGSLSDGSITVTAFVDEDNMSSNSATLIPTQQSVKAYVDSQVATADALSEVLGNGNTTSGTNIQLTTTDEIQFRDTALKISSSADGQLDIDADTEVEITAPTVDINASTEVNISGDLTVDTNTLHVDSSNNRVGIKTTSPDNELTVIGTGFFGASTAGVGLSNSGADLAVISGQTPLGTYKPLKITSNGTTNDYVYFDTTSGIGISNESPSSFTSKLVIGGTSGSNTMTIASGTTGVGNIHFADGTSGDALDAGYIRYEHQFDRLVLGTASATVNPLRITSSGSVGIKIAGDPSTELEVNGTITGTGFVSTGNMTFGDNGKAIFGAGSDLQIYHDGSNSKISDQGTGNLHILADNEVYIADAGNSEFKARFITNGAVELYNNAAKKLETTSTGISVFGTIGIATSAPLYAADIKTSGTNNGQLRVGGAATSATGLLLEQTNSGNTTANIQNSYYSTSASASLSLKSGFITLHTGTSGSERLRINSDGNIGVGTSTVSINSAYDRTIHIHSTLGSLIKLTDATSGTTDTDGTELLNYGNDTYLINRDVGNIIFNVTSSERMRILADGTLIVDKTSDDFATEGTAIRGSTSGSKVTITRDGNNALALNRLTSDGSIITFNKDGTTVGSIGTGAAGTLYIEGDSVGSGLQFGNSNIYPRDAGALSDNAIDLGESSYRFDDIYATNGTIQTSDRNEKQDIEELTDAEQRVAVAAKGLLRKFRWKDAVAEKGHEARTHFGIIAQDLQAAFAAEGLDAGDYGMFISSTWTDEETGEQRTRMGVRYSELLAFIIAAI